MERWNIIKNWQRDIPENRLRKDSCAGKMRRNWLTLRLNLPENVGWNKNEADRLLQSSIQKRMRSTYIGGEENDTDKSRAVETDNSDI